LPEHEKRDPSSVKKALSGLVASLVFASTAWLLIYALADLRRDSVPTPRRSSVGFKPAHKFRVGSRVTIHRKGQRFFGRVRSVRRKCRRARKIVLVKTRGVLSDLIVQRKRTGPRGKWSIRVQDSPSGGYYARVIKRGRPGYLHYHRCRGATSHVMRVGP
jgi:hypothetical protein